MGQRSRKRRPGDAPGSEPHVARGKPNAGAARSDPERDRLARGYARGRERDAAARAKLQPLAPGERPLAVTLAAVFAAALGVANVALLISGYEIEDQSQSTTGALIFAALMGGAAVGMWQCRYWAVLGFQALLGIAIVFSALSLMVASNLAAVALCLGIIAIAGPLFWFLIRAMARIQLPSRRPQDPVG